MEIRNSVSLEGRLPQSLTKLTGLDKLNIHRSHNLCTPLNSKFQAWLQGIRTVIYNRDPNCPWEDRDSLIELYAATGGESWTSSANWLSDKPLSEWHGVTVNTEGRVTGLALSDNNLSGQIPTEAGQNWAN